MRLISRGHLFLSLLSSTRLVRSSVKRVMMRSLSVITARRSWPSAVSTAICCFFMSMVASMPRCSSSCRSYSFSSSLRCAFSCAIMASFGCCDSMTSRRSSSRTCLNFLSVSTFTLYDWIFASLSRRVRARSLRSSVRLLTVRLSSSDCDLRPAIAAEVSCFSFSMCTLPISIISRPLSSTSCSRRSLSSICFCSSSCQKLFTFVSATSLLFCLASASRMVSKRCWENAMRSLCFWISSSFSATRRPRSSSNATASSSSCSFAA
mmetsp:Transcript_99678/g.281377  ORF Transcript_99678/g.281377 Transcript_99678/m.281377 type:complete len:264 (+) Transcript_99678:909-1700(+)